MIVFYNTPILRRDGDFRLWGVGGTLLLQVVLDRMNFVLTRIFKTSVNFKGLEVASLVWFYKKLTLEKNCILGLIFRF